MRGEQSFVQCLVLVFIFFFTSLLSFTSSSHKLFSFIWYFGNNWPNIFVFFCPQILEILLICIVDWILSCSTLTFCFRQFADSLTARINTSTSLIDFLKYYCHVIVFSIQISYFDLHWTTIITFKFSNSFVLESHPIFHFLSQLNVLLTILVYFELMSFLN
jgi:hypothetical protein